MLFPKPPKNHRAGGLLMLPSRPRPGHQAADQITFSTCALASRLADTLTAKPRAKTAKVCLGPRPCHKHGTFVDGAYRLFRGKP